MRCQITYCVSLCVCAGLFGDVLTYGLRGEGRRDWEVDLRYGVKKNHMITLESIKLSFFFTYIIPLCISISIYLNNAYCSLFSAYLSKNNIWLT